MLYATHPAHYHVLRGLYPIYLTQEAYQIMYLNAGVFYLSTFYTRFDLAVRIGLFYGQYAIAGAFSGCIGTFATI